MTMTITIQFQTSYDPFFESSLMIVILHLSYVAKKIKGAIDLQPKWFYNRHVPRLHVDKDSSTS